MEMVSLQIMQRDSTNGSPRSVVFLIGLVQLVVVTCVFCFSCF